MNSIHKYFVKKSRGYASWHKKIPLFIIAHWGIFLIIAVATTIWLSNDIYVSMDSGISSVKIIRPAATASPSPTATPTPKATPKLKK